MKTLDCGCVIYEDRPRAWCPTCQNLTRHNKWREGAIKLERFSNGMMIVSIERSGKWHKVITDFATLASHIVEPAGINEALKEVPQ